MSSVVGIIALPIVLCVGLLITRVATVALTFTGLSRDLARFQARSAFTGCGFTTREAERIVDHPVRRRIIMILMLLGNGTVILAITSLMPLVLKISEGGSRTVGTVLWLALGLLALWMIAVSKWVDKQLSRIIGWALKTFTRLDVKDYHGLLHFSEGYTVSEARVRAGDWVTGKSLIELRLADEGIQVLGIQRADGAYVGTPTGVTYVRNGDTILLYGRHEQLKELEKRPAGEAGDKAHEKSCHQQATILEKQQNRERSSPRRRTRSDHDV